MMRDLVSSPRSLERGIVRREVVGELLRRHRDQDVFFYGRILWNLMVLELWLRRYLD